MLVERKASNNVGDAPNLAPRGSAYYKFPIDVTRRIAARLAWKTPGGGRTLVHEVPCCRHRRLSIRNDEAVFVANRAVSMLASNGLVTQLRVPNGILML